MFTAYVLENFPTFYFCNPEFIVTSWGSELKFSVYFRVSQPYLYWHSGLDNSLLWRARLCVVGFLAYPDLDPLVPPLAMTSKNVSRCCKYPPRGRITSGWVAGLCYTNNCLEVKDVVFVTRKEWRNICWILIIRPFQLKAKCTEEAFLSSKKTYMWTSG